jgi:RNA polymerase sigma factor (sigma-70 family)
MDDWDLLSEYRRGGSQAAFAELVRRRLPLVHGVCLRRLGDVQSAEDVTQDVFLLLALRASRLRAGTVVAGWLVKAADLACRNARRASRARLHHERAHADLCARRSAARDPADQLAAIESALASLGAGDRDILLLRYYAAEEMDEIARRLGITTVAAAKRLSRALHRLNDEVVSRGLVGSTFMLTRNLCMLRGDPASPALAHSVCASVASEVAGAAHRSLLGGWIMLVQSHIRAALTCGALALGVIGVTTISMVLRHTSASATGGSALAAPAGDEGKAPYVISDTRVQEFEAINFLFVQYKAGPDKMDFVEPAMQAFAPAYPEIGAKIRGNMMVVCKNFKDDPSELLDLEAGHPVTEDCQAPDGLEVRKLPAIRCATVIYSGPLQHIEMAERQLSDDLQKMNLQPTGERRHQRLLWERPDSPNNVVLLQAVVK